MSKKVIVVLVPIIILLIAFSFSNKSSREIIFTKNAPMPVGPYSQAIKIGNFLYVAGQVGINAEGKLDSTSIETECIQSLNNIKAIVEAGGMKMEQVVKSTLYVKDLKNFSKINEIYATFFPKDPPARETVGVAALPKGAHFEISVIAVK